MRASSAFLAPLKPLKPPLPSPENEITSLPSRHTFNDREDGIGNGNDMLQVVLGASAGERPSGRVEVKFRPPNRSDLVFSLSSQQEQANDPSEIIIATGVPNLHDLAVRQHAFARLGNGWTIGQAHRVVFHQALAHGPGEKAGQGSPRSICRHRPIFSGQTAELRGNVSATDGGDRFLVQANPVPPEVTFRLPN